MPSPIENGVPHGTGISIGCKPKIWIFNLQFDGTSGTPVWLDELVGNELELTELELTELAVGELKLTELEDLGREDLLVLEERIDEDLLVLDDLIVDDLDEEDLLELEDLIFEDLELELLELELEGRLEDVLEATADEELTTGVADDTLATKELELGIITDEIADELATGTTKEIDWATELWEERVLLINSLEELEITELATTELGTVETELTTLDKGNSETELTATELLLELDTAGVEAEVLDTDTGDETVTELTGTEELVAVDELTTKDEDEGVNRLDIITEESGTEETLELELVVPVGVALNTILSGLSHGIVKSKLIANMLYCTRQVKPSPVGTVCAFTFGVKIVDKEAKLSVKMTAEIVA